MNFGVPSQKLRPYGNLALALLAGCFIGYCIRGYIHGPIEKQSYEIREGGWSYTNPLLECEDARTVLQDEELVPFKYKVKDYIQNALDKKWADKVSVYFRELNDGITFRIGETDSFYPASLLKVPVMMAILKKAETDPGIMRKKIRYADHDLDEIQNTTTGRLKFGESYTVDQLVKRMIIYSDNIPTYLLDNFLPFEDLTKTYRDLGITNPYHRLSRPAITLAASDYMISADTYASFFRILYNASYLSPRMSEWALQLLSETEFKDGLIAGVPAGIKVAHKFGIHQAGVHGEIKQLHDCGIIYYPDHPYMLCLMTSGASFEYLDDIIREISRIVYQEIDHQNQSLKK